MNELLSLDIAQISYGALFVWLLFDTNKKNEAREKKYQDIIDNLSVNIGVINDVKEDVLVQAMDDAHHVFSLLTDRTGLKKRLFHRLEKNKPSAISSHIVPLTEEDSIDYANTQNLPWGEEGSSQSFFELYGEAQGVAGKILAGFMDGDLSALTKERPFG